MAARQDNEALDRKLRPIYDALDARNWKAALKLAEAALKKYKHNQLIRALKSFALAKSGKAAEGLQICGELVKEGPEDELVLNTMTYTYKAAGRAEDITAAYVAATERSPGNTELLAGLFSAYARDGNFVKQQQTAARLVKAAAAAKPAAPQKQQQGDKSSESDAAKYSWWAVCSLVLQARAALLGGPTSLPADKLLQLAETMAARQAGPGGVPASYEELLLLLEILHGQGKHAEALRILDKAGQAVIPLDADRQHLRAAALARSGDLHGSAGVYKALVLANPDDWASWGFYLDCLLPGSAAWGGAGGSGNAAGDGDGSSGGGGSREGGATVQGGAAQSAAAQRFPVGVVGGLAELWDRRHPWRAQQAQQGAGAQEAAWQAVDSTLEELQQAVQAQQAWREQAARGVLRGPTLAPVELALRRLRLARAGGQQAEADAAERAVAEEVLQAYRSTAGNFSCAADLRGGLAALSSPPLRSWLAGEIHAAAAAAASDSSESGGNLAGGDGGEAQQGGGSQADGRAQQGGGSQADGSSEAGDGNGAGGRAPAAAELRRFQARVSAYQIEHELGLPQFEAPAEAEAHAAAVLSCYHDHLHLSASLDEKDRGYGEDLVCIAAAALLQAAQLEGEAQQGSRRVLQALLVLEAAQVRRRVSAPLRLAATALYGLAGAPKAAAASLSALDIKFILHDTMTGHWLLPALLAAGGDAGELKRWLAGISFLHEEHGKEAGETLMLAYYDGTYSKVVEFVDFKERLAASHTRTLGRAEGAALTLRSAAAAGGAGAAATALQLAALEGAGSLMELPSVQGLLSAAGGSGESLEGILRFNEDLSTRPAWLPPHGGACRLGVAEWWEAWGQGGCQGGYSHCWWAEPGAADASAGAPAAAWRRRQLAALTQRCLLPGLLAAALSSRPNPAELSLLQQRLHQLAVAGGVALPAPAPAPNADVAAAWGAELQAHLERQAAAAGTASPLALAADVGLALFSAAYAVHTAVVAEQAGAGAAGAGPRSAAGALVALAALQQLLCTLCQKVAAILAAPGALGALPPGGGFCLASAVLLEEGPWVAACLQAWSKLLRPGGGKKQGSAAATASEEGLGQLRGALHELAGALSQGVGEVLSALDALVAPTQQQQVRQLAAGLDLFGAGAPTSAGAGAAPARPLWGFEPAFKPLEVLQRLVGDQREVVGRLQAGGSVLRSMLAAVQS